MQKVLKVILAISLTANIIFGLTFLEPKSEEPSINEYIERIDSLELVLSTINNKRDSVRVEIDTVYTELDKTEDKYEEIRDIIINNTTSDDFRFFTEYLERNKERLDSINNLRAAQGN